MKSLFKHEVILFKNEVILSTIKNKYCSNIKQYCSNMKSYCLNMKSYYSNMKSYCSNMKSYCSEFINLTSPHSYHPKCGLIGNYFCDYFFFILPQAPGSSRPADHRGAPRAGDHLLVGRGCLARAPPRERGGGRAPGRRLDGLGGGGRENRLGALKGPWRGLRGALRIII